jgi:hypothetical protein
VVDVDEGRGSGEWQIAFDDDPDGTYYFDMGMVAWQYIFHGETPLLPEEQDAPQELSPDEELKRGTPVRAPWMASRNLFCGTVVRAGRNNHYTVEFLHPPNNRESIMRALIERRDVDDTADPPWHTRHRQADDDKDEETVEANDTKDAAAVLSSMRKSDDDDDSDENEMEGGEGAAATRRMCGGGTC